MGQPVVHFEIGCRDGVKTPDFYAKLFDWKLEDLPMGGGESYTLVKVGDKTAGGIMKNPAPGRPSAWLAYVQVDDVPAATKKAKSLGAAVVHDVTEVPGMGWFSVIVDPTGAALGLWQAKGA